LQALILIALVNVAWFGRDRIVGLYPPAEDLYALVGLAPASSLHIEKSAARITEGGVPYLQVSGTIFNVSEDPQPVPELIGRLSNEAGETVHEWRFTADLAELAPGESVDFLSRVADPPADTACLNIYLKEPSGNPDC
jgi:hypothetical protein